MDEEILSEGGYEDSGAHRTTKRPFRPQRILTVLRQRWWLPAIAVALGAVAGASYWFIQPVIFRSVAQMWVRGSMKVSALAQFKEDPDNFFGTQKRLMESGYMQQRALEWLKKKDPKFKIPKGNDGKPASIRVEVDMVPRTTIFELRCYSSDAQFAPVFLDSLMEEVLTYRKETRKASAGDLLESLSTQVSNQERELRTAQEKLAAFQTNYNIVLLEQEVHSGGSRLAQLSGELAALKLDLTLLNSAEADRTNAAGMESTNRLSLSSPQSNLLGTGSGGNTRSSDYFSVQQHLQELGLEKARLSRYMKPKHPKIIKLDQAIQRAKESIAFLEQETREQIAASKQAASNRIATLEVSIKDLEERVRVANRSYSEFQKIEAEIKRQQGLYDQLLSLLRSANLNSNVDQEGISIFQKASPAKPAKRTLISLIVVASAFGGFLGIGLLMVLAWRSDECDTVEDVRAEFDEEICGQIPEADPAVDQGQPPVLGLNGDQLLFTESCRNLRSSLLYRHRNGEAPTTILVTSAIPDEGKSTIALNLARALSLGGAKVLLIDGDMRCGRLHEALKTREEPGLSDLLTVGGDFDSSCVSVFEDHLRFLPRGKPVGFSAELFLRPAFDSLIIKARGLFNYIIIDSVPVFAADDATTVAPKLDGVLFVVCRGVTKSRLAREALELLYHRQTRVLGLVFNRADSSRRNYRYYKHAKYYITTTVE